MISASQCASCGTDLSRDRTAGQCPSCLFALALQEEPHPGAEELPRRYGDYIVLSEVARGGMGVVYRARQEGLQREVALKVLREGALASREKVRRFQTEAHAAARLSHPQIVPIYEIGDEGGQHYFVMRLIEGGSLAEAIQKKRRFSPTQTVRLMAGVARAVQYAHERGILHRDLKPGNILLEHDGTPHVSDFGLARLLDGESSLTLPETVLGSPAYMAPEQATGKAGEATTASDVYSLGAILFELLAGRPPFVGERAMAILQQTINDPAPSLQTFVPGVSKDLEAICRKCLEKEPARRYQSAAQLADDLDRWLAGEAITVRPLSHTEQLWRWARRYPVGAALALGLAVSLAGGAAAVLHQWKAANREGLLAKLNLYAADMNLAQQELHGKDRGRALELLKRHRPRAGEPDLRGWEWRYLWSESQSDAKARLGTIDGRINSLVFTPDGQKLIVGGHTPELAVFDLPTKSLLARTHLSMQGRSLALSKDAQMLFAGLWNGEIRRLNPETLKENGPSLRHAFSEEDRWERGWGLWALEISPSGQWLVSGSYFHEITHGTVWVHDLKNGTDRVLDTLDGSGASSFAFGKSDDALAVGAGSGATLIGSIATREFRKLSSSHFYGGGPYRIGKIAWSPDERWIVSAGTDGGVLVQEAASGRYVCNLGSTNAILQRLALAFSPDGTVLAMGGGDQTIVLFKVNDWTRTGELRSQSEISALVFSPDGSTLVSGGKDGVIELWNVEEGRNKPPQGQLTLVSKHDLTLAPDGQTAIEQEEGKYSVILLDEPEKKKPIRNEGKISYMTAISKGGRRYLALKPDGYASVAVWDSDLGRELLAVPIPGRLFAGAAFSDDGELMVVGDVEGNLELWSLAQARRRWRLEKAMPGGAVWSRSVTFSPSAKQFAFGLAMGTVQVRETSTGKLLFNALASRQVVTCVRFSPDGARFYTVGADGWIRGFKADTGQEVLRLPQTQYDLYSVAVSPDGKTLALGSGLGRVELWNISMATPRKVLALSGGDFPVFMLAFTADGRDLAASSARNVYRWRAPIFSEIPGSD